MRAHELRQWRLTSRLTQQKAADILHVSIGHYRKWEYGAAAIPHLVNAHINLLQNQE